MDSIGIAGAGTMGAGIAQVASTAGYRVVLFDISAARLENARSVIERNLSLAIGKNKLPEEEAEGITGRIRLSSSPVDFSECGVSIEAITEDPVAKNELFRQFEQYCPPDAILATNTSSISITAIANSIQTPERVVGMHFFNPPHLMSLVEIVAGHRTSKETIERTVSLAIRMKKTPVCVRDTPGFIVNRCARPFYGEALRLLAEGVASAEDIDRIVRSEGRFRMGPFELMDLIGIDVNLAVTNSIYQQTFGEPRYRPHPIQQKMVEAGLLGRKTGRGFYTYNP